MLNEINSWVWIVRARHTPPVFFTWPSIFPAYAGTGLRRRSSVVYEGDRKSVAETGLIRGDFLELPAWKQGVSNLLDTIKVRHAAGGRSLLGFKAAPSVLPTRFAAMKQRSR